MENAKQIKRSQMFPFLFHTNPGKDATGSLEQLQKRQSNGHGEILLKAFICVISGHITMCMYISRSIPKEDILFHVILDLFDT